MYGVEEDYSASDMGVEFVERRLASGLQNRRVLDVLVQIEEG